MTGASGRRSEHSSRAAVYVAGQRQGILGAKLEGLGHEVFAVLFLDSQRLLIRYLIDSASYIHERRSKRRGTIDRLISQKIRTE